MPTYHFLLKLLVPFGWILYGWTELTLPWLKRPLPRDAHHTVFSSSSTSSFVDEFDVDADADADADIDINIDVNADINIDVNIDIDVSKLLRDSSASSAATNSKSFAKIFLKLLRKVFLRAAKIMKIMKWGEKLTSKWSWEVLRMELIGQWQYYTAGQ